MNNAIDKNVVLDKTGRRIYPGDLLRSWHYGKGRGKRYLYHVAVMRDGVLKGIPACHLDPTHALNCGGVFPLWIQKPNDVDKVEIIQGYGPGRIIDYRDRPHAARSEEKERR